MRRFYTITQCARSLWGHPWPRRFLVLGLLFTLQACATSSALHVARDQYRHGTASEALQTLSEASIARRDQLLLYMDRGLVAQTAGRYTDSIEAFERAIQLIDELDYISIQSNAAAIITSDWATRYSGEYSERLWIHTFQMLNYLLLDIPEGAAVEARRAAALYQEHGDTLHNDKFTRSLMALSFERAGQINSARVEYRKLTEDFGDPTPLPLENGQSELVLVVASGFIDPKLPGDLFISYDARISFPYYAETFSNPPTIVLRDDTSILETTRSETELAPISRRALEDRGKIIATRQAVRLAAKLSIAKAIEKKDDLAGSIARILLMILEQADTRSWETLPAYLSLLRVPLAPGQHSISFQLNENQMGIQHQRVIDLDLKPGEQSLKLIRTGVNPE